MYSFNPLPQITHYSVTDTSAAIICDDDTICTLSGSADSGRTELVLPGLIPHLASILLCWIQVKVT